jgi:hypothetical protein
VEGAAVAIEVCGDPLVRREFFSFGVFGFLGFRRLQLTWAGCYWRFKEVPMVSHEKLFFVFVSAFWVMLYVLSFECQGS